MGGEPTFVSIDDRDGAGVEHRRRVGPTKRALRRRLIAPPARPLRARRPAAYGQGKWYPGEQLPRWALRTLLARATASRSGATRRCSPTRSAPATRHARGRRRRFTPSAGRALGLDPRPCAARPMRTRLLPAEGEAAAGQCRPVGQQAGDPLERARLARVFDRGLDVPSRLRAADPALAVARQGLLGIRALGLPARRAVPDPRRQAGGLPPAARRLPWTSAPSSDFPHVYPLDPFARRVPPCREPPVHAGAHARRLEPGAAAEPADQDPAGAHRARASSRATGRSARLHAADRALPRTGSTWSPPSRTTAADLGAQVLPGGLPAAARPALINFIKVTPDPGVIEVNIQPVAQLGRAGGDHRGAVRGGPPRPARHREVHARRPPVGTGGGNHMVMGGASPPDSPFLRRPDLLASLVGFWQNHPSLSYLFSGLFIGPTSQAPRVDEARQRPALRDGDGARAGPRPAGDGHAALAGRPDLPQPAGRHHRQHPPRGNLHRQALQPGRPDRPARPGRVPRLRDAAARADEPGAAAAAARADRLVLGAPLPPAADPLGHARCTTASCCRIIVWQRLLRRAGGAAARTAAST